MAAALSAAAGLLALEKVAWPFIVATVVAVVISGVAAFVID